jgi:hypothetical protein
MTLPRTVADVLSRHVAFEIESIDRMYLNLYQPRLQHTGGAAGFFVGHRGFTYASSALMSQMTEAFVADIDHFVAAHELPLISFAKGQRKDDLMHQYLAGHDGSERVLFVGKAQEKTSVISSTRRRNRDTGATYAWLVRRQVLVNHYYFYCFDDDFGPVVVKFSSYFPYGARLIINGNEYAKRQAAKAGIGFTALDNGFAACQDPAAVQAICDQLDEHNIDALLRKWLAVLPHPFDAADRAAGYRYDLSMLQVEFSLTQMLDRPISGRIFFDQVIADNLSIGRPDQVGLIFNRRIVRKGRNATPGRFRTRVITEGVRPSLHIDYKSNKIKQYHKEGQALRTETTINNPREFGIGKRLTNLPALRRIGFTANRRLLHVQRLSHDPTDGAAALAAVCDPVITDTGTRIPGMRFTDLRVQALLATLLIFRLLPHGFTNRDLRTHLAPQLGLQPEHMTSGQISYDLRRLRWHGLVERIPGTFRYRVTDTGLTHSGLLPRVHDRLVRTGLSQLADPDPPAPSRLRNAARAFQAAVDDLARQAGLAV